MMPGVYSTDFIKPVVRALLTEPGGMDWSVQGMGMLRCYLPVEQPDEGVASMRLHIWDSRLAVPNVSMMHTHPWDMESYVVAGHVTNERWVRSDLGELSVWEQDLRPGEGGGLVSAPRINHLTLMIEDAVRAGKSYTQVKEEIHVSRPADGTVTLVYRVVRPGDNPDHAYTFWPYLDGENGWVSAEPHPATDAEVEAVTRHALDRWF